MPLDPSIIMSGQKSLSDLASAVGSAPADIAQAKMLRAQSTMQQQNVAEQQALKAAYAGATTKDASGNVSIDQGKLLSNIGSNPLIAYKQPEISQQLAQNQMAIQKAKIDQGLAYAKVGAQFLGGAKSQEDYDTGIAHMKALNLPTSQFEGKAWTPQLSQQIANDSQDYQERIENQRKQQSANAETLKARAAAAEAAGPAAGGFASGPGGSASVPLKQQQQALDQLGSHILTSRSLGSIKLAYQDGYQAQKGLVTVASALGHPNAQQSALVASDMGKIAQGGAPTESELKDFDPATISGLKAKIQQYLSSKPADTGNAALMNVAKQYFSDIADNSRNMIRSSNKKAINFYGNWMSPKDRATAVEQFVNGDPLDNGDGGLGATQPQGAQPPQVNGIPPLQDLLAEKARRAAKGAR